MLDLRTHDVSALPRMTGHRRTLRTLPGAGPARSMCTLKLPERNTRHDLSEDSLTGCHQASRAPASGRITSRWRSRLPESPEWKGRWYQRHGINLLVSAIDVPIRLPALTNEGDIAALTPAYGKPPTADKTAESK